MTKYVFKTDFGETPRASDPEALFRDLRGRAPDIRHLWSHQADLLRGYHREYRDAKDVAIELPTGAGKTLVGLLIGEWRRQAFNERVAYLCPTRQLAKQVGALSTKYGIKAHIFVGKQRNYPPAEFSEFQSSQAIAVTTYSGIFNSNPRIDDSQTLILDDAHAGENHIADMFSVKIQRYSDEDLYFSLVNLLRTGLPPAFFADITGASEGIMPKTAQTELVPGYYIRQHMISVREILDENLQAETPAWYAWDMIKEQIIACNLFISSDSILIRPFIPPSLTHTPFSQANQRVYMSATLGAGGELERITGVKTIQRLPIPAGWDKRGSGRRLFLIPQMSLSDEDAIIVIQDAIKKFDRSLVLVPNRYDADDFASRIKDLGLDVLTAAEIEDSIEPFVSGTGNTLVLTRYDGLDLPDDACRLLIVGGLPRGTNLQEKFLWSRVGAFSLLRDRVLTRFSQGVGRCTRSDNDYAVILVWGRALVDFVLKHENRRSLNPELQAELQFGIENSKAKTPDEFITLWQTFMEQGDGWNDAEDAILSLRERCGQENDPISERLYSVVSDEVSYLYAMWTGDFESALVHARRIADSLGGDETKGYRAWWYYIAADAALALNEVAPKEVLIETSKDLLGRASKCCVAISWFARLARSAGPDTEIRVVDEIAAIAVENIRSKLNDWGAVGGRFEENIHQARDDLKSANYKHFHRGLKFLGEMLGFRSDLPVGEGVPDCIWSIGSTMYIVHEAKSDHSPDDSIGINDVRQAQSHEDWLRANRPIEENTQLLCLIESPRKTIAVDAIPHAKSLCHVMPAELEDLFEQVCVVLRQVRSMVTDLSDEKVLEQLCKEIVAAELAPSDVIHLLSRRPVAEIV